MIKRGDTRNAIQATLRKNGQSVNLTDCNVRFLMSNGIEGFTVVTNAENGELFYSLEKSAVEKSGIFHYEFEVQYPDGRVETFPNDGYLKLHIKQDLGGV